MAEFHIIVDHQNSFNHHSPHCAPASKSPQ
jgi:hypothetical protein